MMHVNDHLKTKKSILAQNFGPTSQKTLFLKEAVVSENCKRIM